VKGGRLEVVLTPVQGDPEISMDYREQVLGLLYNLFEKKQGDFLHDTGYVDPVSGRRFKLFTFSKFFPVKEKSEDDIWIEYREEKRAFIFHGCRKLRLVISSVIDEVVFSLVSGFLKKGRVVLGGHEFIVDSVNVKKLPEYRKKIRVKTLSPITVYSTLYTPDGRERKTYYYSPFERKFEELVIENLNKKWRAFSGEKDASFSGRVKVVEVKPQKGEKIITFKGTVIKAWEGVFELELPETLFKMAFGAGIGSKNSLGFGCIEELVT